MLPWEILDMSAASVPLISTLNMSSTVVKSSLLARNKQHSQEDQAIDNCTGNNVRFGNNRPSWSDNEQTALSTHLLDCMSTVPLLMMSRSSTAHSVVCWVLRCTVSNIPPTFGSRGKHTVNFLMACLINPLQSNNDVNDFH